MEICVNDTKTQKKQNKQRSSNRQLGAEKEALAAEYLQEQGYRLLTRNFACRQGELDLIACKDGYLVFIEARIHNLVCRKSAAVGVQHLVAAYTVGAEPLGTYVFQDASLHIGLDCIVNLYVVSCSKFCNMVHCLVEQVHVVVVEWSRDPVKLFYRAVVEHVFLFFTENGCKNNEKNPYFRGLKQTNNILTVNDRTFRAGFQR